MTNLVQKINVILEAGKGKVNVVHLPMGRAGSDVNKASITLDDLKNMASNFSKAEDDLEDRDIHIGDWFNAGQKDAKSCYKKVKAGKIWTGVDGFGEGVTAIGLDTHSNVLKAAKLFLTSEFGE